MKIHVLSDLHLEFDDFNYPENDSDIVVLAGDIHTKDNGVKWALENIKDKPVLYVLGNHEFYKKAYPKLIDTLKEMTKGTNVHVLEKNKFSLNGINFFGCSLWTDYNLLAEKRIAGYECEKVMTDFKKIKLSFPKYKKIHWIDFACIHRQSLTWLKKELLSHQDETNIVITHHAPSRLSIPYSMEHTESEVNAAYASNLDDVILQYKPELWIHGHLHSSFDYKIGSTRILCNPRGYSPDYTNSIFNEQLIIEIGN
jgi:Icc-related predicted phosphoesterase